MAFVFDCLLSKCRQTQEALFSSFAFSHFTPFTFLLPFPSFAGHLIDFMFVPLKKKKDVPSRGTGNKDIFVTNVCEINHKELWKLNQMKNENCSGITSLWVQILLKS